MRCSEARRRLLRTDVIGDTAFDAHVRQCAKCASMAELVRGLEQEGRSRRQADLTPHCCDATRHHVAAILADRQVPVQPVVLFPMRRWQVAGGLTALAATILLVVQMFNATPQAEETFSEVRLLSAAIVDERIARVRERMSSGGGGGLHDQELRPRHGVGERLRSVRTRVEAFSDELERELLEG